MKQLSSREGFALPVALFVIGFLAVGTAAAFTRLENEVRANRDKEATMDAFSVAQSGMEYYLTNRRALNLTQFPPPAAESLRFNVPGGQVDVITLRIRPEIGTQDALYFIRARSLVRRGNSAATPPAQQTVTQYGLFRREQLHVTGAWTSLSGLLKNGTAGTISGYDNCGAKPPVAGIAVPTGMYDSKGKFKATGVPDIREMGTKSQMTNDSIKINWPDIVNNNSIQPDIVLPGGTWPSFTDPDYWPVIRVNGNFSVPTDGKGTLIVTGDLVINGTDQWKGIILVGGTAYADGNNTVEGTVISGLNEQLGMTVGESALGNGTKTFVYDSCNIANALSRFTILRVVRGTWSDNFAW